MESYVINLDKRGDRWRKIDALCKTANLPIKRMRAIDGKTELITDEHWLQKYDTGDRFRYMTKGEIACYLSHYKCYEESKSELTLVIEDDAKIPIMFDYNLNKYFPKCYFLKKEIESIQYIDYEDFSIPVPTYLDDICCRHYGKNWDIPDPAWKY